MRLNLAVSCCVLVASLAVAAQSAAGDYLTAGYYNTKNCGSVESIVREEVEKALAADRSKGPALVRLFFHDCWVYGCDGSVLLDPTPQNPNPEKKATANIGLRAFDVIEAIKSRLEAVYPGVVSCADIVAFAARDAARYLSDGHINYTVPSGRKDGVFSLASDADATLPGSTFSFDELQGNFGAKNFTVEELVVLSGAHSIGVAHYQSFKDRLSAPGDEIDADYQRALNTAINVEGRSVVENDVRDEDLTFKLMAGYNLTAASCDRDYLNNTYYHNTLVNKVLFKSDWVLRTDPSAETKLVEYRDKPEEWNSDFADAMVKLSKLTAEGKYFEIRNKCNATNKPTYY